MRVGWCGLFGFDGMMDVWSFHVSSFIVCAICCWCLCRERENGLERERGVVLKIDRYID